HPKIIKICLKTIYKLFYIHKKIGINLKSLAVANSDAATQDSRLIPISILNVLYLRVEMDVGSVGNPCSVRRQKLSCNHGVQIPHLLFLYYTRLVNRRANDNQT
ncbi:MAG TPA: hypothetical protein VN040_04055, partial [Pseudosphingobacterium sp.]|nr:hypothetical protein [Pseudosphingobacterium sp.]